MTLNRLQGIAENYNISYNIDARFNHISNQQRSLAEALNASSDMTQQELNGVKFWLKKVQKKTKKLDLKISALEGALAERNKQINKEHKAQDMAMTNFTSMLSKQKRMIYQLVKDKSDLQKGMEVFRESVENQGKKIAELENQLQNMQQNEILPPNSLMAPEINRTPEDKQPETPQNDPGPITVQQRLLKLQTKHNQRKKLHEEQLLLIPSKNKVEPMAAQHVCNVNSMLIFPNSSTENYVTFPKGLREPLHELSICSWVRTSASYLGTILSYATEDNDNKLVLHGRNGATYDSFHFVIGDPAFRELPLVPMIDGKWHHTCFIWSSIQGKYWFYVDRRLTSTGSRFQKGYEIPPGGSLVLGQEQDTLGGGFDSSEAFVGRLAGFAIWNRALSPGEVSGIATGKGLPRGTILTLADDPSIHGAVERVDCTCLEHCP
uniref:Pentraxin (PTX) domain-containing protein n=1 Tax=Pyxicephalus adspersus TaxID=30357 RepID=A0AAV2ZYU1_PYXAD|nr:TPA: hypothetical protein GDO54_015093 [Pyxicephalus adspersus]